ncbi:MAG: hypothetical protein NT062_29945 [Proteobacteria bacterium]|nr:hypothetical protein [Pseudomonadota bacterium]
MARAPGSTTASGEVPSDLPAGIASAVGAYDPIGHVVIAVVPNATKLETWAWTGTKWTSLAPGPPLRATPQVATDWRQQRVVLFGGFVEGACGPCAHTLADTWTWDGSAWQQITPTIPSLTGAAVAFDPTRGRVQLFGGVGLLGAILDQFWEYDGTRPRWRTPLITRCCSEAW